ncbi:hypothetical protein L873DRAFT_839527 [Choiromyces venosus 120613-1]|uniref:Uncharacterized protein n=1 Tax=Choiromyces venosus 120613-1 TaxID=1336337 RepID=A0A3N4JTA7_9PEZI|nr:hypothetical protein L873DRAFT_839527 [Choiromyces venosus 120613-1]
MSTSQPTIQLLATEDQIKSYVIEPISESYENWKTNKVYLIKNTVIKFVYDEIKVILKSTFGRISDGKNSTFCLIYNKEGRFTKIWLEWWIEFSKFKPLNIEGRNLSNIKKEDYNYLKLAITGRWLMVKPLDWGGLEVS